MIQLREKTLSSIDFYREAAEALTVARESGIKIIINDRVDVALALGADGVHLGQDDLPPPVARKLLGPDALIGFSTHTVPQAVLATTMPLDYIAIGPIFLTTTKESSYPPLGIAGLRRVRQAVGEIPLVAIGGINSTNSQAVLDAGADVLAVIGDIWTSIDRVEEQTKPPA